ncbi:UBP-type zinc finger domain-containing protein [Sphingomonas sp. CL5.1]|uniref:UBP-type zinc finger domain-containing protein n=1 Tax=Sphingomonas sp. CL5.1 TaxID=2653203 RepID=UPI001582052C|nr:UBP-type zinc finger domain-containing protein [Sphingomonas sp. CL5.1]QKR99311.1 UBP-type zinc finger domain-containing protein [Sphingomonas sp. CL5.1]
MRDGINPEVPPSGTGCKECLETGGWWVHLRRCAQCGHVGCCDTSPSRHATAHFHATGHPVIRSFEPDEEWFFDYRDGAVFPGPNLVAPIARPVGQSVPGPEGAAPPDWMDYIHE